MIQKTYIAHIVVYMCDILYNLMWFYNNPTNTATSIAAPMVTAASRFPTSPSVARVTWDSSQATVVDLLYYAGEVYDEVRRHKRLSICDILL